MTGMIEILFGESEAGAMRAAKNKVVIGTVSGPVSVWMAGKKTPPQKPFGGWIEGTSAEVICLGFMMDIGNIREPMESAYRGELIYSMYAQDQWVQDEGTKNALKETVSFYADELRRLKNYLEETPSRVPFSDWYDSCSAMEMSFQNRTVQGGLFMPLLKEKFLTKEKSV